MRILVLSLLVAVVSSAVGLSAIEQGSNLRKVVDSVTKKDDNRVSDRKVKSGCTTYTDAADFAQDSERHKIFNILSDTEINDVVTWMLASSNLNLVPYDTADLYTQNYIQYVYLAEPDKTAALAYLATGTNKPERRAHVHVSMAGLTGNPCIREYTVGPIDGTMTLSAPLQFGGISDIPFDARPTNTKEYDHLETLIVDTMTQLDSEMRDSFGTNYNPDSCTDDFCLTWSDTSPRGPARDLTIWFAFEVEAFFANPIGMYLTFSMGGLDTTKHALKLIVYNGQSFPTIAAFKTAYAASTLTKISNRPLNQFLKDNTNGVDWASMIKSPSPTGVKTNRGAATRLNSNIAAPEVMEAGGKRFLVKDSFVKYLGWTFAVSHNPITGLKLFNVRYRGDSVAYEIGLSEAIAVYSGVSDLVQASTIYGDTAWGLGASTKELVKGIDCPATGMLSDVSFLYDSGEATVLVNTICIFESTSQMPLRRHSDGDSYGGLPTTSLVVRIVLPVYNYDYVVDHIFHVNGAIELRAATSGYLQSTFWSEELRSETNTHGQRIGPFTAGTTHDHVMNFKIDLDVVTPINNLVKTETKAMAATPQDINGVIYKLSNFEVAPDYATKVSKSSTIMTEQGFTMGHAPTMFSVVAKDEKNKWGAKRGYRLKIMGAVENIVADTSSMQAYSFSKHTFAATVRHEDEPAVSSIYDQSDTTGTIFKPKNGNKARPLVDMDRMLANKERLAGSDLVLWVNVGVYHHTHSEDIPVTLTNGNTVNIFLMPYNLYDYDDTLDLGNSVYAPSGGAMDTFDLKADSCPLTYAEPGEGWVGGQTPP